MAAKQDDTPYAVHELGLDVKSNHIYLFYEEETTTHDSIDFYIANKFIKNLNLLMRINGTAPILIHMNLPYGGDWSCGMAIYDTIKSCPSNITILNYSSASSMSSIIFQAAEKRVMMPNSHFMFHDGSYSVDGTSKQARSAFEFDKANTTLMLNIYAHRMNEVGSFEGDGIPKIKKWLKEQMDKKEDVFLSPEHSVLYGLADEVFDYDWSKLTQYK